MMRASRLDLQSRLMEATGEQWVSPRIVLLRAPAGYGKTGTVAEWLGEIDDPAVSVRWVRCAPGQAESIWPALAAALGELAPDDATGTAPGTAVAASRTAVMRLGAQLTRAAILVIDDYHHATNPENDLALVELCEAAPLLTLIVAGRRVQLLDGPLLAARVRMRVFGPRDLAFTPGDSRDMAVRLGVPDSPSLHTALQRTKGWPLAVRAALEPSAGESAPTGDPEHAHADPLSNLNRFALHHLEIVGDLARRILLAAAQLDAISLDQAAEFTGAEFTEARAAVYELLELGVLVTLNTGDRTDFRCHRSVRVALRARSERSSSPELRHELYLGRATRIADTAPLTAFGLFCAAGALAEAERTLEHHFVVITNDKEECLRTLRALPEHSLVEHPTLAAARLFLEMPDPSVSPATLARITGLWKQGLQRRVEGGIPPHGADTPLPLLLQAMVVARLRGDTDAASTKMRELEARLESEASTAQMAASGALLMYYREIASTVLMAGDYSHARRAWGRLRSHAEALLTSQWSAHQSSSATLIEVGQRWLLAALYELAFTEALDGDMHRSAEYLVEAEALSATTGAIPPGISWVSGETARAYLSYEQRDPAMLALAVARAIPLRDRIEQWPLLLIAEARNLRYQRGADWALSQLHSALNGAWSGRHTTGRWHDYLIGYQAMLQSVLGNFPAAQTLIAALPVESTTARLESARLALFSGDDVAALLIAQSLGDPETTLRQRIDRSLIIAVAASACNQTEDAYAALRDAAELLRACGLSSALWCVPFAPLHEVAVAAREAGVCDMVDELDGVPEPARCARYERLTIMEQRTLIAISEHRTTNAAAAELFVTPGTVKKHLAFVYRKLHAKGRDEAILQATRMGLLPRAGTVEPAEGG